MYRFTQFGVFIFMYKQIPFLQDRWDEECHTNLTDCQNIYQKIPPERTGLRTHSPTPPGALLSRKPTRVSSQLSPLFLCQWTFSIRISKRGRCCPRCGSITATTAVVQWKTPHQPLLASRGSLLPFPRGGGKSGAGSSGCFRERKTKKLTIEKLP